MNTTELKALARKKGYQVRKIDGRLCVLVLVQSKLDNVKTVSASPLTQALVDSLPSLIVVPDEAMDEPVS